MADNGEILRAVKKAITIQRAHWMVTKQLFQGSATLIDSAEMAGVLIKRSMIRSSVLMFTTLVSDPYETSIGGGERRKNSNFDQLKKLLSMEGKARKEVGNEIKKLKGDFSMLIEIRNREIAHTDLTVALKDEFSFFAYEEMDKAIRRCCELFDKFCDQLQLTDEKFNLGPKEDWEISDWKLDVSMTGDGAALLKVLSN